MQEEQKGIFLSLFCFSKKSLCYNILHMEKTENFCFQIITVVAIFLLLFLGASELVENILIAVLGFVLALSVLRWKYILDGKISSNGEVSQVLKKVREHFNVEEDNSLSEEGKKKKRISDVFRNTQK